MFIPSLSLSLYLSIYIYIYIHIYIYIYLQATAQAAELHVAPWSCRWIFFGLYDDHLGLHFGGPGLTWGVPCKPFGGIGIHWGRQVAQISYFDNPLSAGASISRPGGKGGSGSSGLWQPVGPCVRYLWHIVKI